MQLNNIVRTPTATVRLFGAPTPNRTFPRTIKLDVDTVKEFMCAIAPSFAQNLPPHRDPMVSKSPYVAKPCRHVWSTIN